MTLTDRDQSADLVHRGWVDEDAVAAFALATNDPNPRYLAGEAVPPLFTAGLILGAHQEAAHRAMELTAVSGFTGSVHGQHDVHFHGPIRPGTELGWRAGFHGAVQTRGGVLVTIRVEVADVDGPVVEHYWSNLFTGGTIERDLGEPAPGHSFPEPARDHPVASRPVRIDRDQAFRYAGVSGDHAGHALDDSVARSEGYPGKILQGMCTLALCSGAVVDAVAGADPGRLLRFAGRLAAPTFPRRDLTLRLYDAGITAAGDRALAFEAVQDGVTVVRHGRAEVRPA